MRFVRVAAVQLNATGDQVANMAIADRLTRAAAADGARLIVLPEKWTAIGSDAQMRAAAETLDGAAVCWARAIARELAVDLVAGSILERVPGRAKLANTSVHVGPDGEVKAVYRKLHMFDVEVDGRSYRESELEQPGEEIVLSRTADGVELGLSICYDLRFPELYRILAVRGARIDRAARGIHAGDDARPLARARARPRDREPGVRDRRQPGGRAPSRPALGRALDDRRPWGVVLAQAPDGEGHIVAELDLARQQEIRARLPSLANRRPDAYRWPGEAAAWRWRVRPRSRAGAPDKRRLILDAAVRVFARQGFHACRVSDIADEAGVAYGLVYHYFASKDEVLDTLFLERWNVMLALIREVDGASSRRASRLR